MVTRMRRVLSIDGGGIKGIIPAAFLAAIEGSTGKRVVDQFDLIAGTSTGGILALGLGLGLSAKDLLDFYIKEGPRVFDQEPVHGTFRWFRNWARHTRRKARHLFKTKYDASALEGALRSAFGDQRLGDSKTRLLIPAFDLQRREVHIFKTSHHRRFTVDWKVSAVNVALATAAAPTYFPGWTIENGIGLIDGGIWANNPVGLAAVEGLAVLNWQREDIFILSLGCSEEVVSIPTSCGLGGFLRYVFSIMMLGQSKAALGTAKLLTGHSDSNRRLYRYCPLVPQGKFNIDCVGQATELMGLGASQARETLPEIERVFFQKQREGFEPYHGDNSASNANDD